MHSTPYTTEQINGLSREDFVRIIGPAFEHSPWIAETAWSRKPFQSVEDLHRKLCEVVAGSYLESKLALIRAHPDLVGRAALQGNLTPASTREQAAAGLTQLTPEEIALFQSQNAAYQAKFGFPFVICARMNKKESILNGFRIRLLHSRDKEIKTALEEIEKIAWYRLADLILPTPVAVQPIAQAAP